MTSIAARKGMFEQTIRTLATFATAVRTYRDNERDTLSERDRENHQRAVDRVLDIARPDHDFDGAWCLGIMVSGSGWFLANQDRGIRGPWQSVGTSAGAMLVEVDNQRAELSAGSFEPLESFEHPDVCVFVARSDEQ